MTDAILYGVGTILGLISIYFLIRNECVNRERQRMINTIAQSKLNMTNGNNNLWKYYDASPSYSYMLHRKFYVWPIKKLWPKELQQFC